MSQSNENDTITANKGNNPSLHRARGIALIFVLMIVAILVSIAGVMAERLSHHVYRVSQYGGYQQAYWYLFGVEELAQYALEETYKEDKTIHLGQAWANNIENVAPTLHSDYVADATLSGAMKDQQACFNINALNAIKTSSGKKRHYLVSVLAHLIETLEVPSDQAESIADATLEYLDKDQQKSSRYGVESDAYLEKTPSYLAPNGLLADASEFRAIQGVTSKIMRGMAPLLCALPNTDLRINVNTLNQEQAPILVALFHPRLTLEDAKNVIKNRDEQGWQSVENFFSVSQIAAASRNQKKRKDIKSYLDVTSQYFELDFRIKVAEAFIRVRSLIYHNKKKLTVIRRRFGGLSERTFHRQTQQK